MTISMTANSVTFPPEAWGNVADVDGPFDPNDVWMKSADEDEQRIAMREWFTARYCDPAHETPYNGREGGHLFINGGPYNPSDELHTRFGTLVHGDVIQDVANELVMEVGDEWAPILREPPPDYYDERFELESVGPDGPLLRARERIAELSMTLGLQSNPTARPLVARLVFSAHIGVLESFLWETAQHWISTRPEVLQRCVERLLVFKEQKFNLSEVYEQHAKIEATVKGYLQNLVWHRWDQVGALYREALDVKLPSIKSFQTPLEIRHHIVHRSGTDKAGNKIEIDDAVIARLAADVEAFAVQVNKECSDKFEPPQGRGRYLA
ncbi:MAG: hypothetical protein Q8K24_16785 [Hydrogenophaga sp.]|nr:hypothetical protein [Hydrogenophaga sp.]